MEREEKKKEKATDNGKEGSVSASESKKKKSRKTKKTSEQKEKDLETALKRQNIKNRIKTSKTNIKNSIEDHDIVVKLMEEMEKIKGKDAEDIVEDKKDNNILQQTHDVTSTNTYTIATDKIEKQILKISKNSDGSKSWSFHDVIIMGGDEFIIAYLDRQNRNKFFAYLFSIKKKEISKHQIHSVPNIKSEKKYEDLQTEAHNALIKFRKNEEEKIDNKTRPKSSPFKKNPANEDEEGDSPPRRRRTKSKSPSPHYRNKNPETLESMGTFDDVDRKNSIGNRSNYYPILNYPNHPPTTFLHEPIDIKTTEGKKI